MTDRRRPLIPPPMGQFEDLAPSHFKVVARRAQAFTAKDIALELGISSRTVSAYLDRAARKMNADTVQDLLFEFYAVYAPAMWELGDEVGDRP